MRQSAIKGSMVCDDNHSVCLQHAAQRGFSCLCFARSGTASACQLADFGSRLDQQLCDLLANHIADVRDLLDADASKPPPNGILVSFVVRDKGLHASTS